jgi:hypothetical protein
MCSLYKYENGTLKAVEVTAKKGNGEGGRIMEGDEPIQGIIHVYMETSQ